MVRGSKGGGLESATAPCPAPPGRDAADSIGAAWLGVEPGLAQGLVLLQPSGHPLVEKTALGSQDFLELALPVLAENKV